MLAGLEIMADLAEHPRPALRGAADHHRIGAGVFEHVLDSLRRGDVAVGDHRDADRRLDRGDGVVFGLAGISRRRACGRVSPAPGCRHSRRCCATIRALRLPRSQPVRILSVTGTSTAPTTASRMRRTSGSSLQQRRARHHVAHFFRRAAHVDVDDLRALVDVVARGCRPASADRRRRSAPRSDRLRLRDWRGAGFSPNPTAANCSPPFPIPPCPRPCVLHSWRNGRSVTPAIGATIRLFLS